MNKLTLEVAKKMLELIADFHEHEVDCENCYIEGCNKDTSMTCNDEFLKYWQILAEKSIEEKK